MIWSGIALLLSSTVRHWSLHSVTGCDLSATINQQRLELMLNFMCFPKYLEKVRWKYGVVLQWIGAESSCGVFPPSWAPGTFNFKICKEYFFSFLITLLDFSQTENPSLFHLNNFVIASLLWLFNICWAREQF